MTPFIVLKCWREREREFMRYFQKQPSDLKTPRDRDRDREYSSCFDMLTLSGTLHNYNDLNITEGMRARVHSKFYGRKISCEAIIYLPEILGQFLGKDNHVMYL